MTDVAARVIQTLDGLGVPYEIHAIDPDYAQALAVLAASHVLGMNMGWEDMTISVPVAERAALAAIRADSEDPWAHLALAGKPLHTHG